MKHETKNLILLFVIIVIAKTILSYFIPSISAFSDEYYYAKLARSFFFSHDFSIHNIKVMFYQPLYPIILSIAYIFKNMQMVYLVMKFINAMISTLIIIPSYLLAKEFLDNKNSLLVTITIALFPSMFSFAPYLLAENLLYPLFMFSFYFLYKSFASGKRLYFILSGVFIALAFLTKTSAIILIALPFLFFIINSILKKEYVKSQLYNIMLAYAAISLIILPWFIRNIISFGSIFSYNTLSDITAYSRHQDYILPLVNWVILYSGYIILSSFIIFGILTLIALLKNNYKDNSKESLFYLLTSITLLLYILIAANHATGSIIYKSPISFFTERPIGRYIDLLLPLVFIIGFMNFNKYYNKLNKYIIASSLLLLFSSQLAITFLLPPNNIPLASIGIYKYIIEFLLFSKTNLEVIFSWQILIMIGITFVLISLLFIYLKKFGLKTLALIAISFFILTNIASYGITKYNADNYWFRSSQMQIGYTLNKIDKDNYSTVLIDARDCIGKIERTNQSSLCENNMSSVAGFFINDNIIVGNPEEIKDYDYVITKHKLDLNLIKEIDGIRLYKNG